MSRNDQPATVISKNTVKRLIRDVRSLSGDDSLIEHGIYYKHSDEDILKGQALIIGPRDTPYSHGFYLFDITYPHDYPHRPPTVKFHTNDGVTRMNPNLYKCGKVCVSILNTWRGDAWTGCQTISTVLLSIASLLNSEPLLNEPGVDSSNPDFATYNHIIRYKNFDTAIYMVLTSDSLRNHYSCFIDIMKSHFIENYDTIIALASDAKTDTPRGNLSTHIYRMQITPYYESLLEKLAQLYKNVAKLK